MGNDDNEFEKEVVQRLARIETKMDTVCDTVKVHSGKIDVLENKEVIATTQWKTLRRVIMAVGGSVGILSTLLGVIGILKGWWL